MFISTKNFIFTESVNGEDVSQSGTVESSARSRISSRRTRIRAAQYHFIVAVNANRGTYLPI